MSKSFRKSEIKRIKGTYANLAVLGGMGAMVGIVLSPSIPVTVLITAVGGGLGLIAIKKLDKLNEEEKNL